MGSADWILLRDKQDGAALASHPPATGRWSLESLAFGKIAWYSPQVFLCRKNVFISSGMVVDFTF